MGEQLAFIRDARGRNAVLEACAAQLMEDIFDPNNIGSIATRAGYTPQTVENTMDGYGPGYNAERSEGERYGGMDCIENVDGFRTFHPDNCLPTCSYWDNCPLQRAIKERQKSPKPEIKRQSGNLIVLPRNGAIIANREPLPQGKEFGVSIIEYNPEFDSIQDEIFDLIETGNLGRFEFCEDQMRMDKISRKVTLTHPNFPDTIFNFAIGEVLETLKGNFTLGIPNTHQTTKEAFPNSGSNIIDPETGDFLMNEVVEYIGGYDLDVLKRKVKMTKTASKLIGDQVLIPEIVTYGTYDGLAKEPIGLYVYTSPKDLIIINDIYLEPVMQLTPNRIARLASGGIQSIYSETKKLVKGIEFNASYSALSMLFTAIRFMHDRGLVHLQLHAGNWGITRNGKVYIGDWETASDQHVNQFAKNIDASVAINRNIQGFINGIIMDSTGNIPLIELTRGKILTNFIEESFSVAFKAYGIEFDRKLFSELYLQNYFKAQRDYPQRDDRFYGREAAYHTCYQLMKRIPVKVETHAGRNDPCPCGSGKKYKHCHGRSGRN